MPWGTRTQGQLRKQSGQGPKRGVMSEFTAREIWGKEWPENQKQENISVGGIYILIYYKTIY